MILLFILLATCLAKSSNAIQNSPSFLTLAERSSLSRSDSESHSQLRSLHGPFHSPLPHGFRNLQWSKGFVITYSNIYKSAVIAH